MGLGSTAKRLQTVADMAEKLYSRVNQLIEQVQAMQETVRDTNDRVESLEAQVGAQGAVLAAVAEAEGIDLGEIGDDIDWESIGWGPDGDAATAASAVAETDDENA